MKCNKCGLNNNERNTNCSNCGNLLADNNQANNNNLNQSINNTNQVNNNNLSQSMNNKNQSNPLIILLGIILVAAAVGVGYFIYSSNEGVNDSTNNNNDKDVNEIGNKGNEEILIGIPILDKAKMLVYDENGICKTDGTTYNYMDGCYIKGASANNYVWYNGFMWRIMGINSDNTVRMITDENVTTLSYGKENTALTYLENEGYIHDWLNEYFYNHLNSTKSIIQNGAYFCSESTNGDLLTAGRTTCAKENEVTTKIGLMAIDEYLLADSYLSYLNISQASWTMTPYNNNRAFSYIHFSMYSELTIPIGIRPVINIIPSAIVTTGNGNVKNFYVLGEDKSTNKTGNLGNTVTSGEYVTLEGHTYRVVRKTKNGVKLILDGFYEETEGTIYRMQYNEETEDNIFVLTSGIGAKLNGIQGDNGLNVINWLGLSNSDKIVETLYYQGNEIDYKTSYKNLLNDTNAIKAKVGLIQAGDILLSPSSTMMTNYYENKRCDAYTSHDYYNRDVNCDEEANEFYWTMTRGLRGNALYELQIVANNSVHTLPVTSASAIRPVITVRNNLEITGGTGTWNNPYQI